jgi:hypothetical protein
MSQSDLIIGALDSEPAQIVMEVMVPAMADTAAGIAPIEIADPPGVGTMSVRQYLETAASARMKPVCMTRGRRPQTVYVIFPLGIDFNTGNGSAYSADVSEFALKSMDQPSRRLPIAGNNFGAVQCVRDWLSSGGCIAVERNIGSKRAGCRQRTIPLYQAE